jgi:uncharacterized protein (TIGR02284 family)
MEDRKDIIDFLQGLAQTCRDGQEGYRAAAEHIKDSALRSFFNQQTLERARFAGELEEAIQRLGKGDPNRSGTFAGTVHRAWLNLKTGLGAGDDEILSSVEAGEDEAKESYKKAIVEDLPANIAGLIRNQHQAVLAAHDYVKAARDARKAA